MILNLRTRALCFTFLLFSLPQAGAVKIWTDLGPIPVLPYSAEGKTALVPEAGNKKVYAFAVFSQVQDTKTRLNLEKEAHVRFLGVHDVTEGHVIYRIAFTRNMGWVRQALNKLTPGFVNVEPILPDDKISRKIYAGHGFARGEMDSATGAVSARVEFFEDVPAAQRKGIIAQCCGRPVSNPPGGQYVVKASPARLLALALLPEVRSVREENLDLFPTNDVARTLTGVNSIQNIDFTLFPPDTTWMSNDSLTGDSVVIGIEDTGIDTLHNDFLEEIPCGSPPCSTLVRRSWVDSTWRYPAKPCPGGVCFHGTHVAAIAAGNGWMSETAGGTRYQWRGVAPKALLTTNGTLGDVNNHSHINGFGEYVSAWDAETWPHHRKSPPTNIIVFAAAYRAEAGEGLIIETPGGGGAQAP